MYHSVYLYLSVRTYITQIYLLYNLGIYNYTKPDLFIPEIFLKGSYFLEKGVTSGPVVSKNASAA